MIKNKENKQNIKTCGVPNVFFIGNCLCNSKHKLCDDKACCFSKFDQKFTKIFLLDWSFMEITAFFNVLAPQSSFVGSEEYL